MSTLWSYGCSWTYSDIHEKELGFIFWPELVSKELNLNSINRAYGGKGISFSTKKLLSDLKDIKKDDIVVFQFSYGDRLEIPHLNKNDHWNGLHITMNKYINNKIDVVDDKLMIYMDYVLNYKSEILINEFEYLTLIFDFIEFNIGATVKYWFIEFSTGVYTKEINYLYKKFYSTRSVQFPNKIKNNNLNLEADKLMEYEQIRVSNENYNRPELEWLKTDSHPNQKGQERISEYILLSLLKKTII